MSKQGRMTGQGRAGQGRPRQAKAKECIGEAEEQGMAGCDRVGQSSEVRAAQGRVGRKRRTRRRQGGIGWPGELAQF
jgi:hypothetical protein